MPLSAALSPVVDLVFPPRCPLCGAALAEHGGLCAGCWSMLRVPGEPCCATCQRPFASALADDIGDGSRCAVCLADPPRHSGIAAATIYNDASRRLVLGFKHGGRIGLAPLLARLIAVRLPPLGGDWVVVPVPLHRWRLWRRGYNQAALLARELAVTRGLPLAVDALVRARRTPSLGGLGVDARARALRCAIRVNPRRAVAGRSVLLVDDVLTSGATTDACIAALHRAGAGDVRIACFARVLSEPL